MFKNPGSSIRSIAITFFWIASAIILVISFIMSFFAWPELYENFIGDIDNIEIFIKIFSFIAAPIIPIFGLYIFTLFLVGFGELVQNSTDIKEKLESRNNHDNSINPLSESAPVPDAAVMGDIIEHPYTDDNGEE